MVRHRRQLRRPNATYTNPVLFADYSDPDVIRDGANYYLIASSFHFVPGIPILQSTDLVHWKIVAHVVQRMEMDPRYNLTGGNRYAGGVWAPSIRKHNGLFYVYFPTPNEGIFVSTAAKITGPWSAPVAVIAQAGLEDPCPFWDDDGSAYLVHSKTGAGPLILHRMSGRWQTHAGSRQDHRAGSERSACARGDRSSTNAMATITFLRHSAVWGTGFGSRSAITQYRWTLRT